MAPKRGVFRTDCSRDSELLCRIRRLPAGEKLDLVAASVRDAAAGPAKDATLLLRFPMFVPSLSW